MFASRLKEGLPQVISESQSGFVRGRSIHNNIRLILDWLDYTDKIEDDGLILFLDFCKAFDTTEHGFIMDTLKYFGFGKRFREVIKTLHKDINSSVLLPMGHAVRRGICQGCPASPLIFILVAKVLAIMIKRSENVQHLNVMGSPLIISQLVDDTTTLLKKCETTTTCSKGYNHLL